MTFSTDQHWIVADDNSTAQDNWQDWDGLISEASAAPPARPERDENDVVSINDTSCTTARPKGVMLTHRNLFINAYNLIAFCRDNMAHFKCPTSIDFIPELPRTTTGKLQKFKLREPYEAI